MAGARYDPALIRTAEEARMIGRRLRRADTVRLAMERNCRHRNSRLGGQALLDGFEIGVADRVPETMAVRVNGHFHEIRIIERSCRAREGRIIERPVGRPQLPDQPAELAAIGGETGAPALGVEI